MQRLIGRRLGESTPRTRPLSMVGSASLSRLSDDTSSVNSSVSDATLTSIDEFAAQAEGSMSKAIKSHGQLLAGFKSITSQLKERSSDVEMMKLELQGAKRQTDVLKDLVDDCIKEKEIMYEVSNFSLMQPVIHHESSFRLSMKNLMECLMTLVSLRRRRGLL